MESVVLLSQQKADDYIEIDLDLSGLDATSTETKATYHVIQQQTGVINVNKTLILTFEL